MLIPADTAAALRGLQRLDSDTERFVFGAEASDDGVVLLGDEDDIEELIGYVAAEANHEENRRRRRRLDDAFKALTRAHRRAMAPLRRARRRLSEQ